MSVLGRCQLLAVLENDFLRCAIASNYAYIQTSLKLYFNYHKFCVKYQQWTTSPMSFGIYSAFWCWVMNGCWMASLTVILEVGSFFNSFPMKSCASSFIQVGYRIEVGLHFTMLLRCVYLWGSLNGTRPVNNSNVRIPILHISTDPLYSFFSITYGLT
jgi:hypothetical protein